MAKKGNKRSDTLPILHPDAAGIDVGASELYVAVSADRDQQLCFQSACEDIGSILEA
ncbi:hypothetical protein [Edaphobacter aggregans]|uniref:hypothetical protein n=1 Tax=Edaphobacter aggregans TaxID=570835 RepID=UPI0012FA3805|nr:hypothetical protein [Edaphobacter aggregans]